MNPWVLGVSTSLIAGAISWAITSWYEKRRELNRIYDAIQPVIQNLAALRRQQRMEGEDVQTIVRSLSTSLAATYAGGSDRLPEYRAANVGSIRTECGVCGLPPTVENQACTNCKLNCCAWNFPA